MPKLKVKKAKPDPDPVVSFRISQEQLQTIQSLAKQKDRSLAYTLRYLVSLGLTL